MYGLNVTESVCGKSRGERMLYLIIRTVGIIVLTVMLAILLRGNNG